MVEREIANNELQSLFAQLDKNGFRQGEIEHRNFIDLSTITDSEWDSVAFFSGNESVPIFKEEIEEYKK